MESHCQAVLTRLIEMGWLSDSIEDRFPDSPPPPPPPLWVSLSRDLSGRCTSACCSWVGGSQQYDNRSRHPGEKLGRNLHWVPGPLTSG